MKLIINSLDDTKKLAEVVSQVVKKGDVICLNGDLGAGKTTFTKFFASFLGIKEIVNSPTFNIIKCYICICCYI
jgi:tRNA threonylcarbamoyladenosine biosynthesis protein TsaE